MFLDSAPWELSTFQCFVRVWYLRGAGGRCLAASLLITVFRRSLSSTIGICLGLACHTRTMLCRVCLSSSRHFPMLCLSSLLRLQYMLCSSFCLCIAGILLRVSSCGQSAKALFFSRSLSLQRAEVKPAVSVQYQSLQTCFFSSSSYLILHNSVCVCVCLSGGKLSRYVCARLRNSTPGPFDWTNSYIFPMLCGCIQFPKNFPLV